MDKEKSNRPADTSAGTSKRVCFNNKSANSISEINPLASTSSLKQKKSHSLLSALVRRTKLKTTKLDKKIKLLQNPDNLKFNTSNSTISSQSTEEMELILEKNKDPDSKTIKGTRIKKNEMSDSEQSLESTTKIKRRFFSKFLKKHVLTEESKKKPGDVYADEGDQKTDQIISELRTALDKADQNKSPQFVPTSFIQIDKSTVPSSLMQGLMSVQNLASRLQQSESHLLQIFQMYLTDVILQKELVDTLCLHSHLHLETERMNNILSMEMWSKQVEIEKVQETALQDALNSVIRQNRQLHSENEILFCTYEKLLKKFKIWNGRNINPKNVVGGDSQIQDIIKHNLKLSHTVELLYKQIEDMESELTNFRKQNEQLEAQLCTSVLQCHNIEATFHRKKAEYRLETATLNHHLKNKEKVFINALDACNKLKKDLVRTEDQTKDLDVVEDWDKVKCNEEDISNFIELSRTFINELIKVLTTLRKQICVKEKEIETLVETNGTLQNNLERTNTDLNGLTKTIDDSNKLLAEHRYKCLEADMKLKEEKLERLKLDYEIERNILLRKIAELENANNKRFAEIEQSNVYISNLSMENVSFRNQIDNLNKLLHDTGSGDIVKELNINKEQVHKLDSQCSQLMSEKQTLLSQLEFLRDNHKNLSECQSTNSQQVLKLQANIDNLSDECRQLQQKYEAERQTVISLQTERKKYLEEKALIKTFFHQMQSEITRLQHLEATVTDISTEANKLAMVADYNKDLGKKLKSELEHKDKTIFKLQSSIEKLNDIQIKNTKEKLSLCHELSELCQIKDKLNSELSWEVQRNSVLDDAKNEIALTANNQIQQYEEFHRKEKTVLKDILKDLKCVVKQRNTLISEKEYLTQEIEFLKRKTEKQSDKKKQIEEGQKQIEDQKLLIKEQSKKIEEQTKKLTELDVERKTNEERLRDMEEEQEDYKSKINMLEDRLMSELKTYEENTKQMEKFSFELREEKEHMEDSIKYLQNNTQKLYSELNILRCNEKDLKDALSKFVSEKLCLQEDFRSQQRQIESLSLEKEKLVNEMSKINLVCEKVLTDFESNINSSLKKEEIFKKEIQEYQNALINVGKENEQLTKELSNIKEEFEKVNTEFNHLKEQEHKWWILMQTMENKKQEFKNILNQKEKLEHDYNSLKEEYNIVKEDLRIAKEECESLVRQMKTVVEQKKADILNHQKETDELVKKNEQLQITKNEEIDGLKINITELYQKLENERSSYVALSEIHKEISTKFIKSVKDNVDEKNFREEAERELRDANECFENLKNEKIILLQTVDELSHKLDENTNIINALTQEKENCQIILSDFQQKYNDALKQNTSLEEQIREAELIDSEEIKLIQEQNEKMKSDSEERHTIIMELQDEVGRLQRETTRAEFLRSEDTLKIHELQRKFETEESLHRQLKNIQTNILNIILKMKNDGVMEKEQYDYLIKHIKNDSNEEGDCSVEDADNI